MKKFFSILFVIIIVLIGGAFIAPSFIDWNQYKSQAVEQVKKQTGLDVEINGNLGFAVIPSPRFSVEQVKLTNPNATEKTKEIAQFGALNVNVSLLPLLQGAVDISSISLIKPTISIATDKDGKFNFATAEIDALMNGGAEQGEANQTENSGGSSSPDIAVGSISIKDGTFNYAGADGQTTTIQNINTDLSAQTLAAGPYTASGSLFYNRNAINFDVATKQLDQENSILPANIKLTLKPENIELSYSGALDMSDSFSAQGQLSAKIDNLAAIINQAEIEQNAAMEAAFMSKGLLTIDAEKLSYDDLEITLGGDKAKGAVKLSYDPFSYDVSLQTLQPVDMNKIYADIKPNTKGSVNFVVTGKGSNVTIKPSTLTIAGNTLNLSGAYTTPENASRSNLKMNVTSKSLDADALMALTTGGASSTGRKSNASQKTSAKDAQAMMKSLILPMNADITAKIDSLKYGGDTISNVNIDISARENSFKINKFSAQNIFSTSADISGTLSNLSATPNIDIYSTINAGNLPAVMKKFEMDTSGLPEGLKSAVIKAQTKGTLSKLDVTANINALKGEVIVKGNVNDPLGNMALDGIALQLKHPNMAQAVKTLSGTELQGANMRKPIDIYAKVSQNGDTYTLNDVKGDLSGMSVTGNLTAKTGGKVPALSGDLTFGTITIPSVMNEGGASSGGSGAASSGSGRWSKEPIDVSVLHTLNADLSLKASKIDYGDWPLSNPSMKIKLNNGNLDLSDVKASIFGGLINTNIKVQTSEKPRQPIVFESDASFNNVDIAKVAASMVGTRLVKLSGSGNFNVNVKSTGASPAALIHDLSGKGSVTGQNFVLGGVDVTKFVKALSYDSKPGDTIKGLWKGSTQGGTTAFETLNGSFTIENGIADIKEMTLDGTTARIETTGIVNLPAWTLSTNHKMIAKKIEGVTDEIPPFEMSFSGSLDNPGQTFGQGALNQYLNNKLQRKLDDLITDKLFGGKKKDPAPTEGGEGTANQAQEGQPTGQRDPKKELEDAAGEAIKGVLDNIFR